MAQLRSYLTPGIILVIIVVIAVAASRVRLPQMGPYGILSFSIVTILIAAYLAVAIYRRTLSDAKHSALKPDIEASKRQTVSFVIIILFALAIDLMIMRFVNGYLAGLVALGLLVFSVLYLLSRIPGAIRFGKKQFEIQVEEELKHFRKKE